MDTTVKMMMCRLATDINGQLTLMELRRLVIRDNCSVLPKWLCDESTLCGLWVPLRTSQDKWRGCLHKSYQSQKSPVASKVWNWNPTNKLVTTRSGRLRELTGNRKGALASSG